MRAVQRLLLLLVLAVVAPLWVYWATHGYGEPVETLRKFRGETAELLGRRPTPTSTPAPAEPPSAPEPPKPPPEEKEAETPPPPKPPEPPSAPKADFRELFLDGRFEESLAVATNEVERADARLAIALRAALPPAIPAGDYVRMKALGGARYEGFAEETNDSIRLRKLTGSTLTFPRSSILEKQVLPRETAIEEIERELRMQAGDPAATVPKLFLAAEQALRIDRPSAAAAAIARLLALDLESALFPVSVRQRIEAPRQPELYRAYIACMSSRAPKEPEPGIRVPKKLGGDDAPRIPRPNAPLVKDPKAMELVTRALELRRQGEAIYDKVLADGLRKARPEEIGEGIRLLEEAIELYQKSQEIEDSNGVQALILACAKKSRNLMFWRQQIEARD